MRTWTIYLACSEAEKVWNPYRNENFDTYPAKRVARAERQTLKFSAELERRMDERDALFAAWEKATTGPPTYPKPEEVERFISDVFAIVEPELFGGMKI